MTSIVENPCNYLGIDPQKAILWFRKVQSQWTRFCYKRGWTLCYQALCRSELSWMHGKLPFISWGCRSQSSIKSGFIRNFTLRRLWSHYRLWCQNPNSFTSSQSIIRLMLFCWYSTTLQPSQRLSKKYFYFIPHHSYPPPPSPLLHPPSHMRRT